MFLIVGAIGFICIWTGNFPFGVACFALAAFLLIAGVID